MNLVWTEHAWEEYLYWQASDEKIVWRINELLKNIKRTPFKGIGKPEPLKFALVGKWSRRINDERRLIYEVRNKELIIYQCRYHY